MALAFFRDKEKQKLTSPVLRATLLSSSLDSWRRKHYAAPFYRPSEASAVMPLSLRRITPQFADAHADDGYDYVHQFVSHEMKNCDHKYHTAFCQRTESRLKLDKDLAAQELRLDSKKSVFDYTIAFDTDTDITTVSVCSIVYGVTDEQGEALINRAYPAHWAKSPGDFFKEVSVGKLVGDEFVPEDPQPQQPGAHYQIQERVEWNWGPQLQSTGSMINVLEINDQTKTGDLKTPDGSAAYVQKAFDSCDKGRQTSDFNFKNALKTDYTYSLVRCMRSKFLSSWVPGGLDADDGRYVAIWCPQKNYPAEGAFLTTVQKRIHYSRAAEREAFPQFAQLLNLLAPAVVTMLLKELAYNSTLKFLQDYVPVAPRTAQQSGYPPARQSESKDQRAPSASAPKQK